jgi:hypothetical protein
VWWLGGWVGEEGGQWQGRRGWARQRGGERDMCARVGRQEGGEGRALRPYRAAKTRVQLGGWPPGSEGGALVGMYYMLGGPQGKQEAGTVAIAFAGQELGYALYVDVMCA